MIDETGLRQKLEVQYPKKVQVGVWDGTSFLLRDENDLKVRTWRDWIRYTWKYGRSVHRLCKWITVKLPPFQRLLGASETVNRNVAEVIDQLGLTAEKNTHAQSYLRDLISPNYTRDVVEATARAWFAQDLAALNGLAVLAAMNPAPTTSISGGNYKLIDRLIKLSDVNLRLSNTVTKIQRSEQRKYRLTIRMDDRQGQSSSIEEEDYDAVIIAVPLQAAKIDFDIDIYNVNSLTPYIERHVTHFTSARPDTLSPVFFNVSTVDEIPEKIFTTISDRFCDPSFFSVESSQSSLGVDRCILQSENMYKVVSAAPLDDGIILKFLGKPLDSTLEGVGVRWVHRQVWHQAFPEHYSSVLPNNIEIADGIFYTGFGEEIVSSLEMSCRMGRLAARLLYYSRYAPSLDI